MLWISPSKWFLHIRKKELTVSDFFANREMKRVLDLNLDKQEARTLFDLFDFEGSSIYTSVNN